MSRFATACQDGSLLRATRATGAAMALSTFLAGCASVSIPLGNVFGGDDSPQHTASIGVVEPSTETSPDQPLSDQPLPDSLNAVAPVEQDRASNSAASDDQPVEELIATLQSQPADSGVRLSQSDLDAMGRALTQVLSADNEPGTFAWVHEATGRSGEMTPFRRVSSSGQGACRIVSVEIERTNEDTIFLADACRQGSQWVFVTPRAGQLL
ncbi:MAG: hypothetical protein AAF590_13210 [Pseudomonadota bacterium]